MIHLIIATGALLLAILIWTIRETHPYPTIFRSKKERYFIDPATGLKVPFPRIIEAFELNLSVIIPAYNEEERLPSMLDECLEFLEERAKTGFTYEVIIVSDGSMDGTAELAMEYSKKFTADKVRLLELEINRGKGGAVRLGVQSARGAYILFADADGATKFSELTKLEEAMQEITQIDYKQSPSGVAMTPAIAIGSRAHLEDEAIAKRNLFRTFLMRGFHFLVWLFTVRGIRDTQCGFKLFSRVAAEHCFESLHVEGWAFDVEILYIAQVLKTPIKEVAVKWTEIDGSKVTPIFSWIRMGIDLYFIGMKYMCQFWKIETLKV